MTDIERVNAMADTESKLLVDIQIQLARIEQTLQSVPALATNVEFARDTSKAALQKAEAALDRLDKIEEGQKWLWRTLSGTTITIFMTAIVTAIKLSGQ
ncbi:hemolysin XhlA family protein [Paenibacillus dokdonensis]|uniref:hemolysin XhlA family protein n=1 Tax=Paenibacillus dokdonensis TaxID=2567944 RepID=UPI001FE938E8|nr:hemolysin XhlA family protein [Paenibacillus dokdonensis]